MAILILSFTISFFFDAAAQKRDSLLLQKDSIVSDKVVAYQNRFIIRYIIANKNLRLHFRETSASSKVLEYEPVGTGFVGIGAAYGKLGIELMIRVPNYWDVDYEKYGITRSFDLQTNRYGRKLCFDIIVQRYKGFYVRNPSDLYDDWQLGDVYPQRSDLVAWNIGTNFYYIFNHRNFSLQSSFTQRDRQTKNAGSFILMSSIFLVSQSADSSLIPTDLSLPFEDQSLYTKARFAGIAVLPGYGYTFVAQKFYFTLSLFMGPAFQQQKYTVSKAEEKFAVQMKANTRSALGYNSEKFFTGISFVTDNTDMRINNLDLTTKINNFKFFAGARF